MGTNWLNKWDRTMIERNPYSETMVKGLVYYHETCWDSGTRQCYRHPHGKSQNYYIGSLKCKQDCLIGMGLAAILAMNTRRLPCIGFPVQSHVAEPGCRYPLDTVGNIKPP